MLGKQGVSLRRCRLLVSVAKLCGYWVDTHNGQMPFLDAGHEALLRAVLRAGSTPAPVPRAWLKRSDRCRWLLTDRRVSYTCWKRNSSKPAAYARRSSTRCACPLSTAASSPSQARVSGPPLQWPRLPTT